VTRVLALKLLDSFRAQFDRLQSEQLDNIDKASEAVAQSVMNGGAWHVHDTGHLIDRELIHRGGGLMFIRPFSWSFHVDDNVPKSRQARPREDDGADIGLEIVRLAVKASSIRKGDVITIGSVSGRSAPQIELALECQRIGATVVVISAYDYSRQVEPRHPSGKRLYECADIFIDNLAPLGDGHMEVEGYDVPIFPTSGINAAMIMWLTVAGVVEKMMAAGKQPQIWKSANIDGGGERNDRLNREVVDEIGY
jgi:uncharacterized phosphosugar-binding protein